MQSMSLTLTKRLSNSKPLCRFSSNLAAYSTTTTSPPPPSPPISAAANGIASPPSSLFTGPWSATQTRGITLSGSDVRVGNLIENRGRAYEVLKSYQSHEGMGKAASKVLPHSVAGYATAATAAGEIQSKVRSSGLRSQGPMSKREQLLKVSAVASLLLLYPNAYSLLVANCFVFWHTHAGIEEILADYVHHEVTREFVSISLRLFLIIAMKDVFLNLIFV
ncbi:uncharacterized protein LOC130734561 [Lotus japonicus]|uniref:uncharacterized protein LOC130734561 n=1 Tax=Lotus japonicus TaxID=34305 RepID=UPI00258C668A|nr:uncharacterized protein LOC130734561 [Lotus japonicus]